MTLEIAQSLLQDMIFTSLIVVSPLLVAALAVGLAISILQAATQVNEQTLTFVPKIVVVLGAFGILFPWIMGSIVEYAARVMDFVAQHGGQ